MQMGPHLELKKPVELNLTFLGLVKKSSSCSASNTCFLRMSAKDEHVEARHGATTLKGKEIEFFV